MNLEHAMKSFKPVKRYRVDEPEHFKLDDCDPADTGGLDLDKDGINAMLAEDLKRLFDLQERLYAQDRWSVLVVLQAMDAAGKDGVIKHVMTGLNPQGCTVQPFKAPSAEELDHDFLWRVVKYLPARGDITIFNRSHYEEVLAVRVHPQFLQRQKLPEGLVTKNIWHDRFKAIRAFERHLAQSGTLVLKFFLHLSKDEQRKRLLARLDEPGKRWKFSLGDIAERKLWDNYMDAYQDMIRATSRKEAPWYVVPADHKPLARLVVARAMVEAMERLDLEFPKVDGKALAEMQTARKALGAESSVRRAKIKPSEA
jgi:PPK2 family polyphosphate:nucleotide phosphotransferase